MRVVERWVEGGRCLVVDDAFSRGQILDWWDELMSRRDLMFSPRAEESTTPLLFSNFIRATDPDWLSKLPSVCHAIAVVLGGLVNDKLRFDRSQINYTLHGDQRLVHRDRGTDWTSLYYANPEWDKDWLGETLIYDQAEQEVLAAVTPRPGRFMVFSSDLPHRVGVPARSCVKPRVGVVGRYNIIKE